METLWFRIQPERLVLSKQLVKVSICHKDQNESGSKLLDVRIKKAIWGRESPLTRRQSQQDEGGSSALDETLRLKGGHMCLLAKRRPQLQRWFCHRFPGRNVWVMGPSCRKEMKPDNMQLCREIHTNDDLRDHWWSNKDITGQFTAVKLHPLARKGGGLGLVWRYFNLICW